MSVHRICEFDPFWTKKKFLQKDGQTDGNTHRHWSSNSSLDIYYTRFWTRNSDFFVWLRLIMRFKYVFNLVEILVTSFEAQRFFQNATIHQQCGNMGLPSLANNLGRKKDFRWQPQYNGFNVFCFWISTLNSWNVFERWFLEFQIHPVWRLWVFVC